MHPNLRQHKKPMKLPYEIQIARPEVQAHYKAMIADGQTESWATMCALQQAPGASGTDREVMHGRNNHEWLNDMPARQAEYITREAKQAGINISGRYYMSGLADSRGWRDPNAWVSGKDDVVRVARKRNLNLQGQINHKAEQLPPPKSKGLSDRIVNELAKKQVGMSKAEAIERVREKHTPHWKKT